VQGAVIAAGVAVGAVLFVLRWLAKRRGPTCRAGRSFRAFAVRSIKGVRPIMLPDEPRRRSPAPQSDLLLLSPLIRKWRLQR
jgi:hypothetical protein